MSSSLRTAGSLLIVSLLALTASAHPGHGEPGAAHYVTEPDHLIGLAVFAVTLVVLYYPLKKRRPFRPRRSAQG